MTKDIINRGNTRDSAIDILKFIAVFFITWSHFDAPLGKYGALATGGAFGDTLFFFMSGYTLLLSSKDSGFFNWYKRRINRIYPTVFAWALVVSILFGTGNDMKGILLHGGGFFVSCIMLFYLLFYPIKRYIPIRYWGWVIFLLFLLQGGAFFLLDHSDNAVMYSWQWSSYFLAMLVGAIIGKQRKDGVNIFIHHINKWAVLASLIFFGVSYYVLVYFTQVYNALVILNIIPLIGFAVCLFDLCSREKPAQLYQKTWVRWIVRTLGGLCLEVYIVQPRIITDKFNNLFPLNLLLIFVAILLAAYCLRSLGRLWAQTFKDEDYNWKEIIKPY